MKHKKITLALAATMLAGYAVANNSTNFTTVQESPVYQSVDKAPEFPGGIPALMKYLQENIQYPKEAKEKNIQGKAHIAFTVETDGSITEICISKSSGNTLLDNEAIRVVESMPKWTPGEQSGKPVRVAFTLPVTFHLNNADKYNGQTELASQTDTTAAKTGEPIYQMVEIQPEFPGGMKELMNFLKENIQYPKEAKEKNIQGKTYVKFVVNTDGSICNAEVMRTSGSPYLDREAVRVIESMPKWIPAKQSGKPVRVAFTLPVTFRLK